MLSLFVAVAAPLAVFLRGRPAAQSGEHNLQCAIRHAMADRSFHFLFWSYAVCGVHTAFITLHLPAYLIDGVLTATHGATSIAFIGLFNVFGCFYAGKLGGRFSKKTLLAAVYFLRAFGILFLIALPLTPKIGRESCRERVCKYV